MSFDVNMIFEELMEWIGSRYDDAFQVILIYNETGYERIKSTLGGLSPLDYRRSMCVTV